MVKKSLNEFMMERTLENERALNKILSLVASTDGLKGILYNCLDIVLSVSWLSLLPKGGIFLVQEKPRKELILVADKNLKPQINKRCARVEFGFCMCGRAAQTHEIQFAECVDDRHDIRFEEMQPHGHYNVPILHGDEVLGVIVLYLPHGHIRNQDEAIFLENIADILSIVLQRMQLEDNLERANSKLLHLATTDELTGLFNRRKFFESLEARCNEANRTGQQLSIIMVDVDKFKRINDDLGHVTGDDVQCALANILNDNIRKFDIACRYGGEEFSLLQLHTGSEEAKLIAERIRRTVEDTPVVYDKDQAVSCTVSLGVAIRQENESPDEVMQCADIALYQSKNKGRNQTTMAGTSTLTI